MLEQFFSLIANDKYLSPNISLWLFYQQLTIDKINLLEDTLVNKNKN